MKLVRIWKKALVLGCVMMLLCVNAFAEDDLWAAWTSDDSDWNLVAWAEVGELGDSSVEIPVLCGAAILAAGGVAIANHKRKSA